MGQKLHKQSLQSVPCANLGPNMSLECALCFALSCSLWCSWCCTGSAMSAAAAVDKCLWPNASKRMPQRRLNVSWPLQPLTRLTFAKNGQSIHIYCTCILVQVVNSWKQSSIESEQMRLVVLEMSSWNQMIWLYKYCRGHNLIRILLGADACKWTDTHTQNVLRMCDKRRLVSVGRWSYSLSSSSFFSFIFFFFAGCLLGWKNGYADGHH